MEPGQESSDSAVARRRRRVVRPTREQTPEPGLAARRHYSDESSSNLEQQQAVQSVRMQIRPPGTMSAHESKILRRRDKTFASAAARSHSQPRQAERLSSPEAFDLIRSAEKRSLSSPRHKEESSEGEPYTKNSDRLPPIKQNYQGNENLSRLEQNLRRFEDERRRFEVEKRIFEKEKRDHKLRYKQYLDNEERKRLMENYRRLSDRMHDPNDPEERRRVVQSMRLSRNEAAVRQKRPSRYESSTPVSSSESEAIQVEDRRNHHRSPPPKNASQNSRPKEASPPNNSNTENPPVPPVRRSVSRNNSLSPIRPARRSKTPDTNNSNNTSRKSSIEDVGVVTESIQRKRSFRNSNYENELEQKALEDIYRKAASQETRTQSLGRKKSLRSSEKRNGSVERDDEVIQRNGNRKSSLELSLEQRRSSIEDSLEKTRKLSLEKAEALQLARKRSLEKAEALQLMRKRSIKSSTETEKDEAVIPAEKPLASKRAKQPTLISRLIAYLKRAKRDATPRPPAEKLFTKVFFQEMFREFRFEWLKLKADYPRELQMMRLDRNKCVVNFIILVLLCGFGGLMFRYTEGSLENIYKCEVRKVKRDFIDHLWTVSHNMREDDWKSAARTKLRKFEEELHAMQELGVRRYPGMKSWNFVNCVLYCWTVVTTIGYGHITPQTVLGRSLTVIYAIIGIPLFLILLADFGKLFTRAIKFVWAYVRRIYYTGTCRKVRKQQQVMDVISGFNTMYDYAVKRPSHFFGNPNDEEAAQPATPSEQQPSEHQPPIMLNQLYPTPQTPGSLPSHLETPTTPYPETFEVDDEFNLPISLASVILVSYIVIGAFVYTIWEDWTYFEAFYFVFISMSTIGFGDFVPNHPIFMMCSILYLIFGLALTSMFINVVQIKLTDTFREASAKITATIGLNMAGGSDSILPTPTDIAPVHIPRLGTIGESMDEELSPNDVINLPPTPSKFTPDEGGNRPPPLLPKKGAVNPEPIEEKPKKKKGFFGK